MNDKLIIQMLLATIIVIQILFFIRTESNYKKLTSNVNNNYYEIGELSEDLEKLKKEIKDNQSDQRFKDASREWKEYLKDRFKLED
jgi:cell division protein FtsL